MRTSLSINKYKSALVWVLISLLTLASCIIGITLNSKAETTSLNDKLLVAYSMDEILDGDSSQKYVKATDKTGAEITGLKAVVNGTASVTKGLQSNAAVSLGGVSKLVVNGNMGLKGNALTMSFMSTGAANDWVGLLDATTSTGDKGGLLNFGILGYRPSKTSIDWGFPSPIDVDISKHIATFAPGESYNSMITANDNVFSDRFNQFVVTFEADETAKTASMIIYRDGAVVQTWDCDLNSGKTGAANAYGAVTSIINAFKSDGGIIGIRSGNTDNDMPANHVFDDVKFFEGALSDAEVTALYNESKSVIVSSIDADDNVAGVQNVDIVTAKQGFLATEKLGKPLLRTSTDFPKILINGATVDSITITGDKASGVTADGATYSYTIPTVTDSNSVVVTLTNGASTNAFTVEVAKARDTYLTDIKVNYTADGKVESKSIVGFMPNIYNYSFNLPATAQDLSFTTTSVGGDSKVNVAIDTIPTTNFEKQYTLATSAIDTNSGDEALDYKVTITRDSSAVIEGITYNEAALNSFNPNIVDESVQTLTVREAITDTDLAKLGVVLKFNANVTEFIYTHANGEFTLVVKDKFTTANTVTYKLKFVVDENAGSAGIDDKLLAKFNLDSTFKAENKAGAISSAGITYTGDKTFVNGVEGEGAANFVSNTASYATVTMTGGYGMTNSDGATFSMWVKDLNKGSTNDWGPLFAIYDGTNAGVRLTRGNVQAITKAGGWAANFTPGDSGESLNSKPLSYILDSSKDKFAHVVVSFSVTNGITLYVNGEAMSRYKPESVQSSISIKDLCNRVVTILKGDKNVKVEILGKTSNALERTANEVVDDFRIYSGVLTLEEIVALKQESEATQFTSIKIGDNEFTYTDADIAVGLPSSKAEFNSAYIVSDGEPTVTITAKEGKLAKVLKGDEQNVVEGSGVKTYSRLYTVKNGLSYRVVKINFTATDENYAKTMLTDIKIGGETISGFSSTKLSYDYNLDAVIDALPEITYTSLFPSEMRVEKTLSSSYDFSSAFEYKISIFLNSNNSETADNTYTINFHKASATQINGISIGTAALDTFNPTKLTNQTFYVNAIPTSLDELKFTFQYPTGAEIDSAKSSISEGVATIYVKDTINKKADDLTLDKEYKLTFKVADKAKSTFYFDQDYYSVVDKTFNSLGSADLKGNHNDTTNNNVVSPHVVDVKSGYSSFGSLGQITLPKEAVNNTNTDGFSYSVWYKRDSGEMGAFNVLASLRASVGNFNTTSVVGFSAWSGGFDTDKKDNLTALVTGDWKLVTTVISGNTAYYYVDGLLTHKTTHSYIGSLTTTNGESKLTSLTLGSSIQYYNANDHTAGDYKAFYFHDAPLSSDAISSMYKEMKNSDILSLTHTSGEQDTTVDGFAGSIYEYDIGFTYNSEVTFDLFPTISDANITLNGDKSKYNITITPVVVKADGATDTEKYVNNKTVTYKITIEGKDNPMFDKSYTIKFKACNINTELSGIRINGQDVQDINADTDKYTWRIPEGTMSDVIVTATAFDGAALAQITYRNDSKKYLIITVISEYGLMLSDSASSAEYSKAYRVDFVEQSVNANLVGITIAGKAIDGFDKRVVEYFNIPVLKSPSAEDIVAISENAGANISVTLSEDGLSAIVKCNAEYEQSQKQYKLNFIIASDNTKLSTVMFGDHAFVVGEEGTEFTVSLKDVNLADIEIVANPTDGGATTFIEKNISANKVIITVTSEYGTISTYTFNFASEDSGCSSSINTMSAYLAGGGTLLLILLTLIIRKRTRNKREDA